MRGNEVKTVFIIVKGCPFHYIDICTDGAQAKVGTFAGVGLSMKQSSGTEQLAVTIFSHS